MAGPLLLEAHRKAGPAGQGELAGYREVGCGVRDHRGDSEGDGAAVHSFSEAGPAGEAGCVDQLILTSKTACPKVHYLPPTTS